MAAQMYAPNGVQVHQGGHMGHMPTQGPTMHPGGQIPPQMQHGMRQQMPHPSQAGHMMHPGQMGLGHQGMHIGAMGHMQQAPQANIYGNPQMGQSFPQQLPQQIFNGQQQHLNPQQQAQMIARRQQQAMAAQQQQAALASGQLHPGMFKMQQPPQNQQQQQQLRAHMDQRNMMNPQMQQPHPQGLQRQPSVQGMRDHPGAPQQHPGQQPGAAALPHTPQNAQMQRPRQPPPSAQAQLQQPQTQPQPTQQPPAQQQQQQSDAQQPDQRGPQHPTPQVRNAPPPNADIAMDVNGLAITQQRAQLAQDRNQQQQMQSDQGPQQAQINQQQIQKRQIMELRRNQALQHQMAMQSHINGQLTNQITIQNDLSQASCDKLRHMCQSINDLSASLSNQSLIDWQNLINKCFLPEGTFRIQLLHPDENSEKSFEVSAASLGRYFQKHCAHGVARIQISIGGGQLDNMISYNEVPASFAYYLDNGSQVVASGSLKMGFNSTVNMFETLEFLNVRHEEFVSRRTLENLAVPDLKQSPEKSKSTKQKQAQVKARVVPYEQVPFSPCDVYGMFKDLQQFVEPVDILSRMRPLFDAHHEQPHLRPKQVLERYISQPPDRNSIQGGQVNVAQMGQPRNPYGNNAMMGMQQANGFARTPGINGMGLDANYFGSPANMNIGLPNTSPYMGTPPPGQMQAPPMMAQGSTQGMNPSTNGSSNASPMAGKRRRPSLAKGDAGDALDGMGPPPSQGGQNKVKQSPRPGKKQKGTG